jgi:hypothetical protein
MHYLHVCGDAGASKPAAFTGVQKCGTYTYVQYIIPDSGGKGWHWVFTTCFIASLVCIPAVYYKEEFTVKQCHLLHPQQPGISYVYSRSWQHHFPLSLFWFGIVLFILAFRAIGYTTYTHTSHSLGVRRLDHLGFCTHTL